MSEAIEELIRIMSRLPGIGERTAARLAFHVLSEGTSYAQAFGENLMHLHERVKQCERCGNYGSDTLCTICQDTRRNAHLICVVARVPDLIAIERARSFHGVYHVLHKLLSPLEGIGPEQLDLTALIERVRTHEPCEVILATPLNVEGEATALYLSEILKDYRCTLSRIATGVPHGGELEFSDQLTLTRAFEGRRAL